MKRQANFEMIQKVCAAIGSNAGTDAGLISLKIEFTEDREIIVEKRAFVMNAQPAPQPTTAPAPEGTPNDKPAA